MNVESLIPWDVKGSECHNFGIVDGCKSHCPVFMRGECTLYRDGGFDEVSEMINQWFASGQIDANDWIEYHLYVYPSKIKALPAPRFPIMSQQEIILTKVRLEAEERYYRTKAALSKARFDFEESKARIKMIESDPDAVVEWYYYLMNHRVSWQKYCIESNNPDYVDDKPL